MPRADPPSTPTSRIGPSTPFTPRSDRARADSAAAVPASAAERSAAGFEAGGRSGNEFSSPPSWLAITNGRTWPSSAAITLASPGQLPQGVGRRVVVPPDHHPAQVLAAQPLEDLGVQVGALEPEQEELRHLALHRHAGNQPTGAAGRFGPALPRGLLSRRRCGHDPGQEGALGHPLGTLPLVGLVRTHQGTGQCRARREDCQGGGEQAASLDHEPRLEVRPAPQGSRGRPHYLCPPCR